MPIVMPPRRAPLRRPARAALLLLGSTTLLAGCASFRPDPDATLAPVNTLTQARTGQALSRQPLSPEQLAERLREPLSADAAVQLALLNQRELQVRLAQLDLTALDVAEAGRLPNPGFRFSRLSRGSERELEREWNIDLARLLTLPLVRAAEQRRLAAAQQRTAAEVLTLAAEVRRAWVRAVSAEEQLIYRKRVMDAADAGAELARRMQAAGNFTTLDQAREQGFAAEAALALERAAQLRLSTRERLVRLLGLENDAALRLPATLPALPQAPRELPDVEAQALTLRLDVQAARLSLEQASRQLDLSRVNRWVSMLDLGVVRNSSNEQPTQRGWEIALELPLFGPGPLPRAEALAAQAVHEAAAVGLQARSEAREAYGLYRGSFELARRHRDELLPLARRVSKEQLLRYNGMLIGVFELLADARSQVASTAAAQDALRDFWLAQANLDQALTGRAAPPDTAGDGARSAPTPALATAAPH
ncbi:MAG: RND transporter [Roseateles depolymerans]|uniref:RND transporter n=1 Tax=Roseateles depolymerans TaxID=76731 RepID=A0A2W5DQZ4_9BURK|nr:MAG: RND transporter [Roseateles depolymerans]